MPPEKYERRRLACRLLSTVRSLDFRHVATCAIPARRAPWTKALWMVVLSPSFAGNSYSCRGPWPSLMKLRHELHVFCYSEFLLTRRQSCCADPLLPTTQPEYVVSAVYHFACLMAPTHAKWFGQQRRVHRLAPAPHKIVVFETETPPSLKKEDCG